MNANVIIERYMLKPNTSFMVVTKGPVATAGSAPNFLSIRGIVAPTTVAKIIITRSEMERTMENLISALNKK